MPVRPKIGRPRRDRRVTALPAKPILTQLVDRRAAVGTGREVLLNPVQKLAVERPSHEGVGLGHHFRTGDPAIEGIARRSAEQEHSGDQPEADGTRRHLQDGPATPLPADPLYQLTDLSRGTGFPSLASVIDPIGTRSHRLTSTRHCGRMSGRTLRIIAPGGPGTL
jgi:hypothetical protein